MIETVKVSEKARNQLITLKKRTGIQNWNTLCRWAFCMSLAEKSAPPNEDIITDSPVEMTWRTFAGGNEALYLSMLMQRAKADSIPNDAAKINNYFKLHLHRGISYLNSSSSESISKLMNLVASK